MGCDPVKGSVFSVAAIWIESVLIFKGSVSSTETWKFPAVGSNKATEESGLEIFIIIM